MHIKKVTGTIKGGVDAVLTEKTLIVGSNGAGKSAIVNAVELALVGGASDIEGRAWVQDVKRLKRLGDSVHVEATLDDDTTCSYRVNKSKADHKNGVGGSLPYREVREALTGSPAKAYKYLLTQCAAGLTLDEVLQRIPADLHDLYKSVAIGSPVEGLLEAQEVAGKKARDAAKEAKGAKEAAGMAAQGLGPTVLESQIHEARLLLQNAKQFEFDATNRQQLAANIEELEGLEGRQEVLERWISRGAEGLPSGAKERVDALYKVISYHLEKNSPTCGVCGNNFDRNVALQAMEQLQMWQTRIAQESGSVQKYERELSLVKERIITLRVTLRSGELGPKAIDPGIPVKQAEDQFNALTSRMGAHQHHQRLQGHILTLEQEADKWKALTELLNTLVKDFVDAGMAKFMTRVQMFLSDSDIFGMKLTKSDCQIGLIRNGQLNTALSGAEWARLLTAIACACASEGVPVVIPEERAWDRENLAKTMRALTNAPCQILLTSTEKPKGKLPAGWSLVEIS